MIDVFQAHRPRDSVFTLDRRKAGQEDAAIVLALDESVNRIAISGNRREARFAMLVAHGLGFANALRAAPGGLAPRGFGVIHPKSDIAHAIAMQPGMLGDRVFGRER